MYNFFRKNFNFIIIFFIIFFISACSQRSKPNSISNDSTINGQTNDYKKDSIFGVGYVVLQPGYAELYAKTGVRWIKLPELRWGIIEPQAPRGNIHNYNWALLDKIIKEYQGSGFNIVPVLRAKSTWAMKEISDKDFDLPGSGGGIVSTAPKDQYWDDYADWVYAVVERYDNDGIDDMPGLKLPILFYEVDSEAQHKGVWQGTTLEYLRILDISYESAKRANKEAKIILSGINFGDIFDDMPNQETIDERIKILKERGRDDISFIITTLKQGKYDLVEFHYNRDWKGIYGTVNFIKKYTSKPIWAGDTTTGPWLVAKQEFNILYPDGEEIYNKIISGDSLINEWYRAEQSKLMTKKIIVAAEVDLGKVILETTNQWLVPANPTYYWQSWHIQNMVDKNKNPLPAYYNLKLLVEMLDNYIFDRRIDVKKNNIFFYKFINNGKSRYVIWKEDNENKSPGQIDPEDSIDFSAYLNTGNEKNKEVIITKIITAKGETKPSSKKLPVNMIVISESPIFID